MLNAGARIGPYGIVSAIGAGGMGEVYRARDAKLGRHVAIKVLPEAFTHDSARMARFGREARLLAALNHPNIASIYGLEDSGNVHALVMELAEGPTLADRIRQGPIPVEDTLRIAKQIADALEYAHEHGIIHRDLKPANVKVSADDTVKILDFGLAKALETEPSAEELANSPTISRMATQAGVLLGTAAYMSPEQAKAKPVDRRADIWAFGCVLYEMLTGKMAFGGDAVTETLAAVLKNDPDWSQLPSSTPIRVRVLLQRCLQKDVRQRLQAMGDARVSLGEVLSGAPEAGGVGLSISAPFWRRAVPWVLLAAMTIAFAIVAWAPWHAPTTLAPAEPMRFQIPLPEKMTIIGSGGAFALSPDGRQLAFAATGSDGGPRIWVRALDSLEAQPLLGSETTASFPALFWSPDSRFIAFDAGGKLKKIPISGGPAETVCDWAGATGGGSWNRDGVIIFGTNNGGVMRVSAAGDLASPLTTLDPSRGEIYHILPSFLPDGRHFIYLRRSGTPENDGIYVGSLDAKPEEQDSKRLLATHFGPAYVPSSNLGSGQLLFLRDGALMAQPFDARRLELVGEPVTVAEQVGATISTGFFSASANGVLAYRAGGRQASQLTWFDRQGKVLRTAGEPGLYSSIALSPAGTRVVVSRSDAQNPNLGLWLLDFSRGTSTRFTFGGFAFSPVWSPDGNRIIFSSNRDGPYNLYQKLASGAKDEELLLKSSEGKYPDSLSRDGRFLLYGVRDPKTNWDLWVLPLEGDKKTFPFLRTEFNEEDSQFSPDGRWVAYASDESGRLEIYVRPFSSDSGRTSSAAAGKWLISTGGGDLPRWRGDGKELFYLAPDGKFMAVEVTTTPVFRAGVPKVLFQGPQISITYSDTWDLTADGKRFLRAAPVAQTAQAPFTVVLNWQAALKK